jgi:hypothetical protein
MAMGNIGVSDCHALAAAVENAGGAIPARLQNLLDGYDHLAELAATPPSDPQVPSGTPTNRVSAIASRNWQPLPGKNM